MKLLTCYCLALTTLLSCQKNSDGSTTPKTKTQLITSAAWKYDNAGIDVNKDGTKDSDIPAGYIKTCDTDNTIVFKSDGTGVVDEGPSKCAVTNPQTTSFTWSLKNGETVINFSNSIFTGVSGDVIVKSITAGKMELQKEADIGLPVTVNVLLNLKH